MPIKKGRGQLRAVPPTQGEFQVDFEIHCNKQPLKLPPHSEKGQFAATDQRSGIHSPDKRVVDEIVKYLPYDDLEKEQRRAALLLSVMDAMMEARGRRQSSARVPVKATATVMTIKATDGRSIPAGQYDLETNAEFIRLEGVDGKWKFLTWRTRAPNLLSLNATPRSSQILYHYCHRDVLWSIIEKGNIWLSDIFRLNDSHELKWGRNSFVNVLVENPELFDDDFRDFAIYMVFDMQRDVRPFVVSFSANGDLLSQWRAYSDDGSGFSLGLRASHIHKKWGVRLKKIEYRETRQEAIIAQSLVELQDIWRMTRGVIVASDNHIGDNPNIFPALKYPTPQFPKVLLSNWQMWERILSEFAMDLSSFKHPSFFEEKEFRIIRAILYSEGKYYDPGAGSRGGSVPVKERMRGSDKIAYVEFPIDTNHEGTIVREVILGPKNTEDVDVVRNRIENAGFRHVMVKRSAATYR